MSSHSDGGEARVPPMHGYGEPFVSQNISADDGVLIMSPNMRRTPPRTPSRTPPSPPPLRNNINPPRSPATPPPRTPATPPPRTPATPPPRTPATPPPPRSPATPPPRSPATPPPKFPTTPPHRLPTTPPPRTPATPPPRTPASPPPRTPSSPLRTPYSPSSPNSQRTPLSPPLARSPRSPTFRRNSRGSPPISATPMSPSLPRTPSSPPPRMQNSPYSPGSFTEYLPQPKTPPPQTPRSPRISSPTKPSTPPHRPSSPLKSDKLSLLEQSSSSLPLPLSVVDGREDTPSPLPDVPIECPRSPSPQFGSPQSSRSPSPAPAPTTAAAVTVAPPGRSPPLPPLPPPLPPLPPSTVAPSPTRPPAIRSPSPALQSHRMALSELLLSPTHPQSCRTPEIMSPPPQSPRHCSGGIMSPTGGTFLPSPHRPRLASPGGVRSPPTSPLPARTQRKSPGRSSRAKSPMDLPVPKWKPDPILRGLSSSSGRRKSPPREVVVTAVTPRIVAIPPSAEKLRRFSEEKEKHIGHDTSDNSIEEPTQEVIAVKKQDTPVQDIQETKPTPIVTTTTPTVISSPAASPSSNTSQPTSVQQQPGKLDFKSAVLDELSRFAERGDTTIYTGTANEEKSESPAGENTSKDNSSGAEDIVHLLSPTKSRSKPPTSASKFSEMYKSMNTLKKPENTITSPSNNSSVNQNSLIKEEDIKTENLSSSSSSPAQIKENQENERLPPINGSKLAADLMKEDKVYDQKSNGKLTTGNSRIKEEIIDGHKEKEKERDKNRDKEREKDREKGVEKSGSSSSRNNSSSRNSSSSSKKYECFKCYKRSKVKRYNIGVQCNRKDKCEKTSEMSKTVENSSNSNLQRKSCFPKIDFGTRHVSLPRPGGTAPGLDKLKYGYLMHIETYPNGGATIVHMYQDEFAHLPPDEQTQIAKEFLQVVFSEDESEKAHHVCGIVHDSAANMPDLLDYMAEHHSSMIVKAGVIGHIGRNSDLETYTMEKYRDEVYKHYGNGTFRAGPLHQVSVVGTVHEEVGGYFPHFLQMMENNQFLKLVSIIFPIFLNKLEK